MTTPVEILKEADDPMIALLFLADSLVHCCPLATALSPTKTKDQLTSTEGKNRLIETRVDVPS